MKDTVCAYLVDLAQAYVSLNEPDLAVSNFTKASKTGQSAFDYQLLYEQWALFKLSNNKEEQGDNLIDAKELYKQSVEWAATAKSKSHIAYYQLKELLENEIGNEREMEM